MSRLIESTLTGKISNLLIESENRYKVLRQLEDCFEELNQVDYGDIEGTENYGNMRKGIEDQERINDKIRKIVQDNNVTRSEWDEVFHGYHNGLFAAAFAGLDYEDFVYIPKHASEKDIEKLKTESDDLEKGKEILNEKPDKKEIEDRIGELKQAIKDGVSEDEKKEMEKEIAELEKQLEECDKTLKESDDMDYYGEGIYGEIEDALVDAGFDVDRYTDAGVMTYNIGWEVSKDGEYTQLDCPGSYYNSKYDKNSDDYEGGDEDFEESAKPGKLEESLDEKSSEFRRNFSNNLTDYINKSLSFGADNKQADLEKLEDIISSFKEEIDMVNDDFIEYINSSMNESAKPKKLKESFTFKDLTDDIKNEIYNAFDGSDFTVNSINAIHDDGHISFDVTAYGPEDEEGNTEMTREVELEVPEIDFLSYVRKACEDWMSEHRSPDSFYESDKERGNESIDELNNHLVDLKKIIDEEGSIDEELLKAKVDEMLDLLAGYKEEMNKSLNESAEGGKAFWEKGFKPGDKIESSGAGEIELIDLDKGADYVLLKRNSSYQPYVAAWAPSLNDEGKLYWGQGHYYSDENEAREYFNSKKLNESVTVATSDGSTVDMQDAASVSVNDNVVSVTNGQTTVTITSTPDLPAEELVSTVPTDVLGEPADELPAEPVQEEPAEEVPAEEIVSDEVVEEPVEESVEDPIIDDVKNDLGIEPGSDEEEMLNSLYDEPSDEDVVEAQTLDVVKNQGDVYMLLTKDDEGNEQYWVCENFDQENNEGEEAEVYSSLEQANDDYLNRVGLSDYKDVE